ncbi:MAG: ABC transporter ATP-binding protein [Bacteroidota bacterium]|jgi:branched-chain amino acid transport system ATP-binding protein
MLEVRDLHAWYGKSHILQGVRLDVAAGECVSLVGRNGVGRSTTIKSIMGMVDARGSVRFKGEELVGLQTFRIAHKGLGYVPENRDVFPSLTVAQNLALGLKTRGAKGRWSAADMYELFPRLAERRDTQAGVLSGGEQQMLTLARTLMGDPDLVMVDEPTEGLAPKLVELVAGLFREIKRRGVALLLVEQKLAIALDLSERLYVMGHGRIVFEGTPGELRGNAQIRREWLEV